MPTAYDKTITQTIAPMEGWCSTSKACTLAHLIVDERLSTCLEIGVFGGKSIVAMALAQRFAGLETAYCVGVDPWRADDCIAGEPLQVNIDWWNNPEMLHAVHRKCMEAIWASDLQHKVFILRNTSVAAYTLLSSHPQWSLIHIDGNHSEESSTRDVSLWLPQLSPGGILVFDDVNWSSNKGSAVKMLRDQCDLITEVDNCAFFRKPS